MPDTRPDLTGVRAVAVTACPLLAAHLTALHPAVTTALLTRLAGIGTLSDTDGLLLLTHLDPSSPAAKAAGTGLVTETLVHRDRPRRRRRVGPGPASCAPPRC